MAVAGVCACAVVAGVGASGAAGAADDLDGTAAIDATGVTVPWMVEQRSDGTILIRWGNIRRFLTTPTGTVLSQGLPAGRTWSSFSALGVDCSLALGRVTKLTSSMVSTLSASCTAGFGTMIMESYFQYRSSLIWRRYSGTQTWGPYTRSPTTVSPATGCNNGAGSHPYRLRGRGYSTALGWGPWYNGPTSGSYNCGP